MMLLPSLVLRVTAISSAETRSMRATFSRKLSRILTYLSRFWKEGLEWKSRRYSTCRSITGREAGHTLAAFR